MKPPTGPLRIVKPLTLQYPLGAVSKYVPAGSIWFKLDVPGVGDGIGVIVTPTSVFQGLEFDWSNVPDRLISCFEPFRTPEVAHE